MDMLDNKSLTIILNFSRDEILDTAVVLEGIAIGRIACYVTDFPNAQLIRHEKVITFPHIGASTVEAKENCAYMIVDQVTDFLENGNIHNSVNFPESTAPQNYQHRLIVANRNIPNMIAQISTTVAGAGLNIENMVNSSKGEIAYTILDVDNVPPDSLGMVAPAPDGAKHRWTGDPDVLGVNAMTLGMWAEVLHRWVGPATSVVARGKSHRTPPHQSPEVRHRRL